MKITTLLLTLATASLLTLAGTVKANDFWVTNLHDGGDGSLRQAILAANANPGADVIRFADGLAGQISLTSGQLLITEGVTIEGPGANVLAVDAGQQSRVLQVQASVVTIRGLTLRNGRCPVGEDGGGIRVGSSASLTLEECAITGNTVPAGTSTALGGGAHVDGSLVARRCLFADNVVEVGAGGAVYVNSRATATLENCTLAGNKTSTQGGAIFQDSNAQLTMETCTVTANTAGEGGGAEFRNTPSLRNCIFAGNTAPAGPDVYGSVASQGYNLIGNTSRSFGWVATDLVNKDPLLGPLADNGGPTLTCALWPGSPALDAAAPATFPATDQRGVTRPQGPACDIGAFELSNHAPQVSCAAPSVVDCAPPTGVVTAEQVTVTDLDGNQTLTLVLKQDDVVLDTQTVLTPVDKALVTFKEVTLLPGSHPLTVEVEDGLSKVSCTSSVTVNADELPPTIIGSLPPISVTAASSAGAVVSYSPVAATDNCTPSAEIKVTYSRSSGTVFPIGKTTVNCTATDGVGNQSMVSFTVTVVYPWSGVLQPINQDNSSVFQLGSTVPVIFQLTGGCASIKNLAVKFSFVKLPGSAAGTVNEKTVNAKASTGNLFRYDAASGQYVFNWSTKGLSSGVYRLQIDLGDGVTNSVNVALK